MLQNIEKISTTLDYFKIRFLKKVAFGKRNSGGRNFLGRVCVNARGGATKKYFYSIDLFRRLSRNGYVIKIFRDLNRTAFLALILYENGLSSLILATEVYKWVIPYIQEIF